MKRLLSVVFAMLILLGTAGCVKSKNAAKGYPLTVEGVTLTAKPQKIAVTSKALEDVLVGLGYGGVVINATAQYLTGVGDLTGGNAEVGVVLTNEPIFADQIENLDNLQVPVIKVGLPKTLAEVRSYWELIGKVADGNKGGSEAAAEFDRLLQETASFTSLSKTAVLLCDRSHIAVTGLEAEALEKAGYKNAAGGVFETEISDNELASFKPDIIFCTVGMKEALLADEKLSELSAVKNGEIYEVDTFGIRFASNKLFTEIQKMNKVSIKTEQ